MRTDLKLIVSPLIGVKTELEEENMLVSATEMLQKAKAGHYAVGQFNINNLEWTKAILTVAEECKSPVILGYLKVQENI